LLVCPVSAATCERSLSALRRVKTWLRNTLHQERLNHNLVCLIHRSMMRDLSPKIYSMTLPAEQQYERNYLASINSNCSLYPAKIISVIVFEFLPVIALTEFSFFSDKF
jgi:hypothetical protein